MSFNESLFLGKNSNYKQSRKRNEFRISMENAKLLERISNVKTAYSYASFDKHRIKT